MLEEKVSRGEIKTLPSLKAEFRRLSILLHPDTSGQSSEAFVLLKEDFGRAETRLRAEKPVLTSFDTREFCRLVRTAHAKGLPSPNLSKRPTQRTLIQKISHYAALDSLELSSAIRSYLEATSMASGALTAALNLFLDAMLIHGGGGKSHWRAIESFLSDHVSEPVLEPLVQWIQNSNPMSPT
jgi:hypothetical protein